MWDDDADPKEGEYHWKYQITALDFLRGLPGGAMHYLTHLVIVVPAPQRVCEQPTSEAWKSWRQAIELLGSHNRLDGLTLELHITNKQRLFYWGKCWSPRLEAATRGDYFRVVGPLAPLRGRLRRLFVFAIVPHLYWGTSNSYEDQLYFQRDFSKAMRRFTQEIRQELEVDVAKRVMGPQFDPAAEQQKAASFFWYLQFYY
jgi:hypothetical protein